MVFVTLQIVPFQNGNKLLMQIYQFVVTCDYWAISKNLCRFPHYICEVFLTVTPSTSCCSGNVVVEMLWWVGDNMHVALKGPWTCVCLLLFIKSFLGLWFCYIYSIGCGFLFFICADLLLLCCGFQAFFYYLAISQFYWLDHMDKLSMPIENMFG